MIRDNRQIMPMNTIFDFYGNYKQEFYGRQSNCISVQQNGDAYQYQNAIYMLQKTFKSISLKHLQIGWTLIAQRSLQIFYNQNKQSKSNNMNPQQNLNSNETSKYTSIILPLTMKQVQFKRTKYKQYKQLTTTDRERTPATQRISKYKNQQKFISNYTLKNKAKRNLEFPMSTQQVKRQIRISRLQKIVKKIKKQHQMLKNGRYYFQSNAQSRQSSQKMLYQNEVFHLREEIERYRFYNSQLSEMLVQKNRTQCNEHKDNSQCFQLQDKNNRKYQSFNCSVPYGFKPMLLQSIPVYVTQNHKQKYKNSKSYSKSFYSEKKDSNKKGNSFMKCNNNVHTIDNSHHPIDNQNDIQNYPPNLQQDFISVNRMAKNHTQNYEQRSLKFCQNSCKCCCHHGCKH